MLSLERFILIIDKTNIFNTIYFYGNLSNCNVRNDYSKLIQTMFLKLQCLEAFCLKLLTCSDNFRDSDMRFLVSSYIIFHCPSLSDVNRYPIQTIVIGNISGVASAGRVMNVY